VKTLQKRCCEFVSLYKYFLRLHNYGLLDCIVSKTQKENGYEKNDISGSGGGYAGRVR
jgi:hypothetical protein